MERRNNTPLLMPLIKHHGLLFLGLVTGIFMNGIDFLAIGIAMEPMRKELSINTTTLHWFLAAFAIGNASFQPTSGRFADLFGRKEIFMIAQILFTLSSAVIALSSSSLLIIFTRLIQGAAGGVFITVGIAILASLYDGEERADGIARMIGVGGLGMALGPVLGGFLIHYTSWRIVFLINVPIGLIGLFLSSRYIPHLPSQRKPGEKIDWLGIILLTITLLLLTMGISQGQYWGWAHLKSLLFFALTLSLLTAFIFWERKTKQPLIEFYLFKTKNFLAANCAGFILYFTLTGWLLIFGIYMQRVMGMSALSAGLSFLPFGAVMAIFSNQMTKWSKRYGPKRIILVGFVIGALSFLGMAMISMQPPYFVLMLLFALYGLSFILVNSCTIPAALEYMPPEKSGGASGNSMMIRWLGAAIGAAVISTIFVTYAPQESGPQHELAYYTGLRISMFTLCALSIAGLFICRFGLKMHSPCGPA